MTGIILASLFTLFAVSFGTAGSIGIALEYKNSKDPADRCMLVSLILMVVFVLAMLIVLAWDLALGS